MYPTFKAVSRHKLWNLKHPNMFLLTNNESIMRIIIFTLLLSVLFLTGCSQNVKTMKQVKPLNPYYSRTDTAKLRLPNSEWRKVLSPEVYAIAREKDTERAFTGKYWDFEGIGTYYCAACGNPLFRSDSKFSSSCGWPSFFQPIRENSVVYEADNSYGMHRTEVLCGRCDGHLGHIFDDGPPPTGLRYCINSIVIDFEGDAVKQ